MKIAIISGTLPPYPCGVGKHTHCLATALIDQGHQVVVFSLPQSDRLLAKYEIQEFDRFGLASYWRLAQSLKSGQFDVVHLQYPTKRNARGLSVISLPLMLRLLGLKVVMTLHEFSRSSWLGKIRNAALIVAAQRVILPNEDDLKSLSWSRRKLVHVPLGPTILAHPRSDIQIIPDAVGFLGFLDGSKGEEDLLQAASMVAIPIRLKFLTTLNPNLPHHQSLLEQVDRLNISSMVEWVNPDSDQSLADHLQSCAVVVLPFKQGVTTRNSTLLEALSYGKPTIAAVDRTPALLSSGQNCVLVPTQNPAAIATALTEILESAELRDRLRDGAVATMTTRGWPAISKQTVGVYQAL